LIQKWRAEIKNDKIPPQTLCFLGFLLMLCFEILCSRKIFDGRKSFKNGRGFWQM